MREFREIKRLINEGKSVKTFVESSCKICDHKGKDFTVVEQNGVTWNKCPKCAQLSYRLEESVELEVGDIVSVDWDGPAKAEVVNVTGNQVTVKRKNGDEQVFPIDEIYEVGPMSLEEELYADDVLSASINDANNNVVPDEVLLRHMEDYGVPIYRKDAMIERLAEKGYTVESSKKTESAEVSKVTITFKSASSKNRLLDLLSEASENNAVPEFDARTISPKEVELRVAFDEIDGMLEIISNWAEEKEISDEFEVKREVRDSSDEKEKNEEVYRVPEKGKASSTALPLVNDIIALREKISIDFGDTELLNHLDAARDRLKDLAIHADKGIVDKLESKEVDQKTEAGNAEVLEPKADEKQAEATPDKAEQGRSVSLAEYKGKIGPNWDNLYDYFKGLYELDPKDALTVKVGKSLLATALAKDDLKAREAYFGKKYFVSQ